MTVPGAVLVHGLWHGAWCWDAIRAALAERGVDSVAVELPLTDLPADTRATLDALDRFGRPAVLVGHSPDRRPGPPTATGAQPPPRDLGLYVRRPHHGECSISTARSDVHEDTHGLDSRRRNREEAPMTPSASIHRG